MAGSPESVSTSRLFAVFAGPTPNPSATDKPVPARVGTLLVHCGFLPLLPGTNSSDENCYDPQEPVVFGRPPLICHVALSNGSGSGNASAQSATVNELKSWLTAPSVHADDKAGNGMGCGIWGCKDAAAQNGFGRPAVQKEMQVVLLDKVGTCCYCCCCCLVVHLVV